MASQAALEEHPSGCKLPPGYGSLLDRFIDVVGGDPRVRAAWVHGSVARGDADEVSDLDVIIAVADDDIPAFAAGWRGRLDEVTPTVMARPSHGTSGSWLAITPACQRFDLWVEPASGVASSPVHDRHVLFDYDNLAARVPVPPPAAPPSPDKLRDLARRFAAAASVARVADELLMLQVIWVLRWILYDAYVETNRPLPRTGLKQWSAKLTDAQRATFVGVAYFRGPGAGHRRGRRRARQAAVTAARPCAPGRSGAARGGDPGLGHRLGARWKLGTSRGGGVLRTSLVPDGRASPS